LAGNNYSPCSTGARRSSILMSTLWEKCHPSPQTAKKQYTPIEVDVLKVLAVATGADLVLLNVIVHTGARRSEVFRLMWNDVNFEKNEITLWTRKSKDQSMKGRTLPMNGTLQKHLRWLWNNREFKESTICFCMQQNEPWIRQAVYDTADMNSWPLPKSQGKAVQLSCIAAICGVNPERQTQNFIQNDPKNFGSFKRENHGDLSAQYQ